MRGGPVSCIAVGLTCLMALSPSLSAPARPLAPGAVQLLSPVGGERWTVGSLHLLRWQAGPQTGPVRLEFSTDNGRRWRLMHSADTRAVADQLPSSPTGESRLLWKVPASCSQNCRVRLSSRGGTAMSSDTSDKFTVARPPDAPSYTWHPITLRAAFAGRDGAGALTFRDRMWLLGGWNPGDKVNFPQICNSEVWNSADGLTWTEVNPQAPWEGRHTAGYAVFQDKMWVIGGDCNQGHYQWDVWSSSDGVKWDLVNNKVPWGPRVLHHTVVFRDKLWVMGGQTMPAFAPGADEYFYSDVWCSANGQDWEKVADNCPWAPRGMIGGAAVHDGYLWLLGGGTYDTPQTPSRIFRNDVWRSADGVKWEQVTAAAPWNPRQYHEVAVWDGKLWVMEGYHKDGGNRNDVWYSADGVNWYEVPETPWAPRHAASLFVHADGLWMVAGNNMFPDVWKLERK